MHVRFLRNLVFVFLGVLILGHVAQGAIPPEMMPDKTVVYKTADNVKLSLRIFNPPNHKDSDKNSLHRLLSRRRMVRRGTDPILPPQPLPRLARHGGHFRAIPTG